jgi:hypothetical protein
MVNTGNPGQSSQEQHSSVSLESQGPKDVFMDFSRELLKEDPGLNEYLRRLVSDFPNVFSNRIGRINNFEVKLNIKEGDPIQLKPYKLDTADRAEVDNIMDDWLDQGIIEISESP